MKILIVGAGRMGFSLAQRLADEDHEVFVLDRDPDRIEQVRTRLDVMTYVGSGTSLRTLREIGGGGMDMMIAASGWDEVNIVSCLQAKQVGIPRRIARVGSNDLLEDLRDSDPEVMGVSEFINPTMVTVSRIAQMVLTPGTAESAEFGNGRIILRALHVEQDTEITAAPLNQLNALFADEFRIAAVRRGHSLCVPNGSFLVRPGDTIYVVMRDGSLETFLSTFHFTQPKRDRVFIFGATAIGIQLAAKLEDQISDVILVDPDGRRCDQATMVLKKTSVINGSPLDRSLMEDLKVGGAGYFLALSESDETNLTSALLAGQLGASDTLILTIQPEYVKLYEDLPVSAVVSPLLLSVGAILRSVLSGRVITLFNLAGDRGEATEVMVAEDAPAVGQKLKDLRFPPGAMVAAVINQDTVQVAGGGTVIHAGDSVILIATRGVSRKAIALFSGKDCR